jgi:hypothetical protein
VNKFPLVLVTWYDANGEPKEITLKELPKLAKCATVGWLVQRDDKAIWVASEYLEPTTETEEDTYRFTTVIPAGWVIKIRNVK